VPVDVLGIHPRDEAGGELHELLRLVEVRFAEPYELEAVGVVAVGAGEVLVVLGDDRERAVPDLEFRQQGIVGCERAGAEQQEQREAAHGQTDSQRP
jgi:hypothetical protein